MTYKYSYHEWEPLEIEHLEKLYEKGMSNKEMSKVFERSPSAIGNKIFDLALILKYPEGWRIREDRREKYLRRKRK